MADLSIILARGKKASPDAVAKARSGDMGDNDEPDADDQEGNGPDYEAIGKAFYEAMRLCKKGGDYASEG